ncbi:LacI family DNA-binding transcriptional regulator [Kineococcus sp. R86509]|uniref:LacI family DNA-binding transcriptional regulator n=1 Tax=Kineococcus sp. R86509 TaxID=3093851 RepID=UPI0036D2C7E8
MEHRDGRTPTPRMPTIRDVAEQAGVSKSLASLALRGDPGVSEARRASVRQAAEELGYHPNRLARALAQPRSGTVGVLLNDLRNPWFVELLAGLTASLDGAGLAPVLADSFTSRRVGRSAVDQLRSQRVDAVVVVGTTDDEEELRRAASAGAPIVLAGTYEPGDLDADVVVNDDEAGATGATRHLLDLGHRRIVHLRGPGRVGSLRAQGFEGTLADAGLTAVVVAGGAGEESGYAAARRVLESRERPTAIFAYNDLAAIGTLSAAHDLGLSVPGDLSVVGYDNTYLAAIRHLSLTSVDNGTFAIGVQSGRFVTERLAGAGQGGRVHRVAATLAVRRTTGPAPATTG